MSQVRLTICIDGAAFEDQPESEVAAILRSVANRITEREGLASFPLYDVNGNKVGAFKVGGGEE